MCDIGTALIAMSAVSGVGSAVSQNAIGKQNAAMARYQAEQTREIGAYNERKGRDRMSRLIAQQRGQLAARGVQGGVGSALDLGEEAATERFMEAQASRYNTDSRATAYENEARISDYQASTSLFNGIMGTGASVLGQSLDLWPELAGT